LLIPHLLLLNLPSLFAWRYFKSKKNANAINLIAWISVVAICVGTAALIVVLSVYNGFEGLVSGLYGDFYSDLKLVPAKGKVLHLNEQQLAALRSFRGIRNLSLVAEEKAVIANGNSQAIVYMKGVDDHYAQVSGMQKHTFDSTFDVGTASAPLLVVGVGVESALRTRNVVRDSAATPDLVAYFPNREAKSLQSEDAMVSANVNVSDVFLLQQEFNDKYTFTNIDFVKYMLNLPADAYTSVELSVKEVKDIPAIQERLQEHLGKDITVQSRYEQNQSVYTAMQVEKWIIYGILSLILIVAAFNMVGALTMLILEKQKDIAVLQAIGAGHTLIQRIFVGAGLVIACVGAGIGILLALVICLLQIRYHFVKLEGGTFLIDYYPVKLVPQDFALVGCTVFCIALLASWIPARKAAAKTFSLKS
jgi:lipoprotein-releasing system permease protein